MDDKSMCEFCCKTFAKKKNMYEHVRNVHKLEPNIPGTLLCPISNCNETVITLEKLRHHIEVQHSINIEKEEITFPDKAAYFAWKEKLEKTGSVNFSIKTVKALPNGEKKTYLRCHRSGHLNSTATCRTPKSQGSCKIGRHCPATLEVVEKSTCVTVTHFKTHVGHELDLKHIKISDTDKEDIIRKLAEGESFERILDDIRNSSSGSLERLHLITRKDLNNISNSSNILKPERLHKDDTISVHLFIENMKELGDASPVAFSKAQGIESDRLEIEDFMLILFTPSQKYMFSKFSSDKVCIDTTHDTNMYDFHLTTLLVVDEFGRGFPAAFCLSNKISERHMTVFFEVIREKTSTVQAQFFMSDDFPAYYNAWKSVMGEAKNRLLCIWHVDKNWRQSLQKIKNTDKKVAVYKYLRTLLEITDKSEFELLLNNFLSDLEEDLELTAFAIYFKQQYASRYELWAYCCRQNSGINTNMYLESLHRVLKHIYMEGKKNKRLDTCISLLLKLTKDKSFERYIRLIKGSSSEKISLINIRHRDGQQISVQHIKEISSNEWVVQSQSCNKVLYSVRKNESVCEGCQLNCNLCNICIHAFSCSCIDCCIKGNMCKHIHAIVSTLPNVSTPKRKTEHDILEDIYENELIFPEHSKYPVNHSIKQKLLLGLNLIEKSNISKDNYNEAEKHLDKFLSVLQKQDKTSANSNLIHNEPANKKLTLQRLHSTKKKRRLTKALLNKPTTNYKQAVLDTVKNNSEMLNISYGAESEHSYSKLQKEK